jgi:hypothetical protein
MLIIRKTLPNNFDLKFMTITTLTASSTRKFFVLWTLLDYIIYDFRAHKELYEYRVDIDYWAS